MDTPEERDCQLLREENEMLEKQHLQDLNKINEYATQIEKLSNIVCSLSETCDQLADELHLIYEPQSGSTH